ncbi:MAG: zinc-finger domain-containing protein [Legionellales bacterium]|nr:zinc-finger domain-containing protein [Legionellales bacterium]
MFEQTKPANTQRRYEITRADLPLSCPTKEMRLWDAHPRVFLPIEQTGREVCPYCEAEYILTDFIEK